MSEGESSESWAAFWEHQESFAEGEAIRAAMPETETPAEARERQIEMDVEDLLAQED